MTKLQLTKLLLKNYNYTGSRITFLQQQKELLNNTINSNSLVNKNHVIRKKVSYSEKFFRENLDEISLSLIKKFNECDEELNKLTFIKKTIDNSLQIIDTINTKYRLVLEKHYFYNVSVEDIAEIIHLGRTSSYDLQRNALYTLSKVLFGEK